MCQSVPEHLLAREYGGWKDLQPVSRQLPHPGDPVKPVFGKGGEEDDLELENEDDEVQSTKPQEVANPPASCLFPELLLASCRTRFGVKGSQVSSSKFFR